MSLNFCLSCHNILRIITSHTELIKECSACNRRFPTDAKDTLRLAEVFNKKSDMLMYATFLKNAAHDNVNPKKHNPCPKCNHKITVEVVIGDDKKYINLCPKCNHRF